MPPSDFYSPIVEAAVRPLLWLIPLVLLLGAVQLFLPKLRGVLGEAQVGKILQRIFPAVLHDVILPDGRGGLTQIDHVALTPAGLLVVETKNYRGAILGQAREATWTQSMGGRRHSFQNPLRQNYLHLKAVEALAGGAPVWGRVVFTQAARFPKGLPEGVSQVSRLRQDLAHALQGEVPPAVAQAWQALQRHARTDPAARRAHLAGLEARHGADRRGLAVLILLGLATAIAGGLWWSQHLASAPRVPPLPAIGLRSSAPAPTAPRRVDVAPVSVPSVALMPPAPRPLAPQTPNIAWSDSASATTASEDCKQAMVEVLVANTPENRQRRTAACARKN